MAKERRFVTTWFKEFNTWLEYSIAKDTAYCLCCHLFKEQLSDHDCFTSQGYKNWKKEDIIQTHVGGHNSAHCKAWEKCQILMNQNQHIDVAFNRHSIQTRSEYRIRLTATIDCIQYLLRQELAFRGNNESGDSQDHGNFLELLQFLADHNETINNVVLENAPKNLKLICPTIQKDIVYAATVETTNCIINDLQGDFFAILVDESRVASITKQMAVVLRYVIGKGYVVESFLGIVHVMNTSASSLKSSIEALFSKHGLSMLQLRGQGYDGASNIQGEFNGLKSLIMKENPSTYYIHCFAHQLQLALVAVATKQTSIALIFNIVTNLTNIVRASCKRRDLLREKQYSSH